MAPTLSTLATPVTGSGVASLSSGSFSPGADSLVIVHVAVTGNAAANGPITLADSWGLGFTKLDQAGNGNNGSTNVAIFYALVASIPGAGTVTATFSGTPVSSRIAVAGITGHDAATPLAGTVGGVTSLDTLSLTLSEAPTADDLVVGAFGTRNQNGALLPGSGFTAQWNEYGPSPSATMMLEQQTGTTSTAVDVSGLNTVSSAGVATIVKAAPSGGGGVSGSGSSMLPVALAVVAAGALALSGSGSSSLPALQAGGSAQVQLTGSAASALPVAVGSSGTGALELTAAGASSLPLPTGSGAGGLRLAGTSSITLPVVVTAGGGDQLGSDLTGSGSSQLPPPAAAGTGVLELQGVSSASVLARPVASAAGTVALSGSGAAQLPATRAGGTAVLSLQGAGSVTLPRPTASGSDLIVNTPAARTLQVPLEDRTWVVPLEDRTVVALPELRQPSPTPDSRTVVA